ncbi:MAG: PqqD family protein [bacterium]
MQNMTKLAVKDESFVLNQTTDNDFQVNRTNLLVFNELINLKVENNITTIDESSPAVSDASMKKLSRLAINEEGFIFNPNSGDSYHVSETGLLIIDEMKFGKTEEEIALLIEKKYNVNFEEAMRDVADFRATLKKLGLI